MRNKDSNEVTHNTPANKHSNITCSCGESSVFSAASSSEKRKQYNNAMKKLKNIASSITNTEKLHFNSVKMKLMNANLFSLHRSHYLQIE